MLLSEYTNVKDVFMRTCRSCCTTKEDAEFPTQRKYGFRGDASTVTYRLDCKDCVAIAAREYRKTHTSTPRDTAPKTYLRSAIGCRVSDARRRAIKSHGLFDIDIEYMHTLFQRQAGLCAISGVAMTTDKGDCNVLSIDKISPSVGYVRGNVQWVTWAVNRAKGDMPLSKLLSMCNKIIARCNDYPEREYSQVAGSAQHQKVMI